ncbi:hypothetical protein UFOVP1492_64 [uncultured Caudovirales phage]|uniref:Uncharacterized protein n=1 Tax=uncultured Caudovirales phage TaxID=2100421 RepID=A0A6J5RHC4_9CAUD|nr:hypothetical protein UFOVP1127_70 [uncultured Caudovirales phage]CAB4192991.1 hypothetical protein UFOVP1242_4 [uncultured Caudovirales phage]CAB4217689.1 hypothetical protein UFOVP1492_64 [uncultured Caudovirales phage]CAB5231498.1 hypothetical protein UFOVP1580_93 [uncultured Caudovirales phage]
MAQLTKNSVFKVETLSISEYTEKYGGGVSPQAVSYAMDNDKIDFVRIGKERLVVMTENTKTYVPNSHPRRGTGEEKSVRRSRLALAELE